MSDSFGTRLRQRREQQQIALTAIAEQTKIKVSLLEALERDDISNWPLGIFRRAFIRSYANAIGLEPNVVLQEFLSLHPDVDVLPVEPLDLQTDGGKTRVRPPTRLRFLVGSAFGSLSRGRDSAAETRNETAQGLGAVYKAPSAENEALSAVDEGAVAAAETPAADEVRNTDEPSAPASALFEPDLAAVARLCTELGRTDSTGVVEALLPDVARVLHAVGLIAWIWDAQAGELRPALAHGYPDKLLAQLPSVRRDADNATAAAFRSAYTCVVNGSDRANGAVVVPLVTPEGCAGVLAIELQNGREQKESLHALATIVAAQLARAIRTERATAASDRRLA